MIRFKHAALVLVALAALAGCDDKRNPSESRAAMARVTIDQPDAGRAPPATQLDGSIPPQRTQTMDAATLQQMDAGFSAPDGH